MRCEYGGPSSRRAFSRVRGPVRRDVVQDKREIRARTGVIRIRAIGISLKRFARGQDKEWNSIMRSDSDAHEPGAARSQESTSLIV